MIAPALDAFTRAYLDAALWTSAPDLSSSGWRDWTIDNIDPKSIERAIEDCRDFQTANAADLESTGADDTRNGIDFWLTRNHHGAGFWDRGYEHALSERLTAAAHAYGEANCYGPQTLDNGSCSQEQLDAWDGIIYIE